MAPIRAHKKKKKTEEQIDPYAPVPSLQFQIPPSSDWWDNFSRRFSGPSHGQNNLAEFGSFFKFSRKTFDYICGLVEEEMMTRNNFTDLKGELLSLNDRVAIALRRLSSKESLASIGSLIGVHQSTIHYITWSFILAMETKAYHHLQWPSTKEEMQKIKSKFEIIRGLPNCCGAIDTMKIAFHLSSGDPSSKAWCNEDNEPSMTLLAIVDADMRFLYVFSGVPGCLSDSDALCDSNFFRLCEKKERLNGDKLKLAENVELREYIVGDGEFPLLPWLVTPYTGGVCSVIKEDFNKRHQQTWNVANQALVRLKETWELIRGKMWRPDKHKLPRFIYVCCLLHNIMIDQNDAVMQYEITLPPYHRAECQQENSELPDKSALAQRDSLAFYLSSNLPPF